MFTPPSVSDFKNYFVRDFPYGTGTDYTKVLDADISKAIDEASFLVNEALFETQLKYTIGYLYATAHFLVIDLRNASQGIVGAYNWLEASKAVGSVSSGYVIPEFLMKNPSVAMLSKTNYGAKYVQLIQTSLIGNFGISSGLTKP